MPVDVKVPTVGESITQGVLGNWSKQDGAFVNTGDVLFEVETDKVTSEVFADQSGILHHLIAAGTTVDIGQVVATIEPAAAPVAQKEPAPKPPAAIPAEAQPELQRETASVERSKAVAPASASTAFLPPVSDSPVAPALKNGENRPSASPASIDTAPLSPSVRKLVEENHITQSEVPATGRGGRLLKGDVLAHLEKGAFDRDESEAESSEKVSATKAAVPATPAAIAETTNAGSIRSARAANVKAEPPTEIAVPAPTAIPASTPPRTERVTRKRMTQLRAKIADRLLASQHETASLTTFNEADLSNIMALRTKFQDRFTATHQIKVGFMSFFVQAVVAALKAVPNINARIEGEEVVLNHFFDIGVAISTERGLLVPVIRDADQMSLADIERAIAGYAKKARDGKITLKDLEGGVFTITNGGVFGSLLSTPILNPPQSGILGMHSIQERPIAVSGRVEIRPMMYLALTYDHRMVDGKEAVTFLVRIKEFIEQPGVSLLGI